MWPVLGVLIQAPIDDPNDREDFYANMPATGGDSSNGILLVLAVLGFVGWLAYRLMRENDQLRAEVRASRDLQTPPPTPSEKQRIDEYFRFKGRPSGDSGPEPSQ